MKTFSFGTSFSTQTQRFDQPLATANTVDAGVKIPTVPDMLKLAEDLGPRYIGDLMGCPVYVDLAVEPGMVELRGPFGPLRFSVDHPYVKGTKIERAAREALES